MKILIVAEKIMASDFVRRALLEQRHVVDEVLDGEDGVFLAHESSYDLIILDTISIKDEVEICKALRLKNVNTPVLVLGVKDNGENGITALDAGADDYLAKPFAFDELLARVRALIRRAGPFKSPKLQVGELVLDTLSMELWRNQRRIELTRKEYIIMEYFMRHPNIAVSKTVLADHAWDLESESMSNLIEVYIHRLRAKIDQAGGGRLIETVRGLGYRLRTNAFYHEREMQVSNLIA